MSYDGSAWSKPRMLADSDNFWTIGPAVVPFGADGILAVYSSDCAAAGRNNHGPRLPTIEERSLCHADARRGSGGPAATGSRRAPPATVKPVHPHEAENIQQARSSASTARQDLSIVRGEFHRHTEYTAHRDGDGTLEEMWRYSQDAADMDWMGNADHDNGYGHQYPWWIIQKTHRLYHNPPWFIAPFTYERSVGYPNGHRNVIFAQRGIRPLPRGDHERRREDRHARHQDALCLSQAVRRDLRQPHQRHRHGHRLARQRSAAGAGGGDLSGRSQQLRVRGGAPAFSA